MSRVLHGLRLLLFILASFAKVYSVARELYYC